MTQSGTASRCTPFEVDAGSHAGGFVFGDLVAEPVPVVFTGCGIKSRPRDHDATDGDCRIESSPAPGEVAGVVDRLDVGGEGPVPAFADDGGVGCTKDGRKSEGNEGKCGGVSDHGIQRVREMF
jgi:hypothetical protein